MAYDSLKKNNPLRANKEYISILHIAALDGQDRTESAIRHLISRESVISLNSIRELLAQNSPIASITDVAIDMIDLEAYDELLCVREEVIAHG